ncbi:capsular polysaccharide export protein, LipB/KpsS family [Thermocrinis sp.]
MPVGIFARGILRRVPHLEVFLQDKVVLNPKSPEGLTAIAGWGYKPTAQKAIQKAKEWNLPYWALEDGFIRSFGLGFEEPPLSIVIDPVGIYYDASKPSLIENLLNDDSWKSQDLIEKAVKLRKMIIDYEISKYNNTKPVPEELKEKLKRKENILLIDQTEEDMSVILGGASRETFKEMYESALEENPDANIIVKFHPDVIKGKKKGYLTKIKTYSNVIVLSENYNPIQLLKLVDKVYTISSQMGFEALLLEKHVVCFGIPFYAGWGLTEDKKQAPRRGRKITLDELVAVSHILYPRYAVPYGESYKPSDVFEVVECLRKKKGIV